MLQIFKVSLYVIKIKYLHKQLTYLFLYNVLSFTLFLVSLFATKQLIHKITLRLFLHFILS